MLAQRFGKDELLDAGFDRPVLAQMLSTLSRFSDDEIPLPIRSGRCGAQVLRFLGKGIAVRPSLRARTSPRQGLSLEAGPRAQAWGH